MVRRLTRKYWIDRRSMRDDVPGQEWTGRLRSLLGFREERVDALFLNEAAATFATKGLGLVVGFASQIVIANAVGTTEYGYYVYSMSWFALLIMLSVAGLPATAIRFIPEYLGRSQSGHARGFLFSSQIIALCTAIAVGVVGLVIVEGQSSGVAPGLRATLLAMFAVLPIVAVSNIQIAAVRAVKRAALAELLGTLVRPVLLVVGLLALVAFGFRFNAVEVVVVFGIASILILVASYTAVMQTVAIDKTALRVHELRRWIAFSVPLLFISGVNIVLKRLDVLMLGSMVGTDASGIYGAATKLAEVVLLPLAATNAIVAPLISQFKSGGDSALLEPLLRRSARILLVITLAIGIALWMLSTVLLSWFGPDFAAGVSPLRVLLIAQIVNAAAGSVGYLLIMLDKGRVVAVFLSITVVLNFVLNWVMIPKYGMVGAAYATGTATILWNVALVVYAQRQYGIRTTAF